MFQCFFLGLRSVTCLSFILSCMYGNLCCGDQPANSNNGRKERLFIDFQKETGPKATSREMPYSEKTSPTPLPADTTNAVPIPVATPLPVALPGKTDASRPAPKPTRQRRAKPRPSSQPEAAPAPIPTVTQKNRPKRPKKFYGMVKRYARSLEKKEILVTLTWMPSSSPDVVAYRIYRKGKMVKSISAKKKLRLKVLRKTSLKKKKYTVCAVNKKGVESKGKRLKLWYEKGLAS